MSNAEEKPFKYEIKFSSKFKKHLKLVTKRRTENAIKIKEVSDMLQRGEKLPERYHDHELIGNWAGHRECHILPDLLLIYRIIENILILEMVDTGTHSDLFSN